MRGPAWIAALLAVGVCACGSGGDRSEPRASGSERLTVREVPGSAKVRTGKPTRAEVAVIRGWAKALRAGHVAEAARLFALPAHVADGTRPMLTLEGRDAVVRFLRRLPCGGRLVATERGHDSLVIATFRLTERRGGHCADGVGGVAAAGFLIRGRRITHWVRVEVPGPPRQPDASTS
jgi:hypothetical protein